METAPALADHDRGAAWTCGTTDLACRNEEATRKGLGAELDVSSLEGKVDMAARSRDVAPEKGTRSLDLDIA